MTLKVSLTIHKRPAVWHLNRKSQLSLSTGKAFEPPPTTYPVVMYGCILERKSFNFNGAHPFPFMGQSPNQASKRS